MSENTPLLRAKPANSKSKRKDSIVWGALGLVAFTFVLSLCYYKQVSHDLRHIHGPSTSQSELIAAINAGIDNSSIASFSEEYYLAAPHLMGQDKALAEWTMEKFIDYGFEAEIETYEVLRNLPVDHSVRILNGSKEIDVLSLEEDVLDEDETTGRSDRIPTFHGYSASGNATGEVVYANYGRKMDYDLLEELGVDIKDKVVLVRYGEVYRGLKVLAAEDRGAKAVLIFSEPMDDGEITEVNGYKPYPKGPARNPTSVQRGSVQDISHWPGDPTTPGFASTPGVNHTEPVGIPKIPSIPISQLDGERILKLLDGHGKTVDGWKGVLNAQYSTGPSELHVEVFNEQDYEIVPIYNVIATLEGVIDETIIVGNHRDAWILGGADPNSGSAAVLETARIMGGLYKKGWKPFRTIQFASWDGEEYALVGSTEHGEDHASYLSKHCVAYINVDVACSGGNLHVNTAPLLDEASYEAAKKVPSPHTPKLSLYDYWAGQSSYGAQTSVLGSGSDFTVFLDHLGIPSVDIGFAAGSESPAYHYHSNYDSLHWMKEYGDPTFERHAAISRFIGTMAVDLSGYSVLPLRTTSYAQLLKKVLNDYFSDGPKTDEFSTLLESVDKFEAATTKYDEHLRQIAADYSKEYQWWQFCQKLHASIRVRIANVRLMYFERIFLHEDGIEGRPFFKHIAFAPGRYTGYSGQVLPGIGESIEDKDDARLALWIEITKGIIEKATERIS